MSEKAAVLTNHNKPKKTMKEIQEETKHTEKEFGAAGCNYGKQTTNSRGEVAESSL